MMKSPSRDVFISDLERFEKHFRELSVRLDQSFKDDKTILSTKTASAIVGDLATLVKLIKIHVPKV